MVLLIVSSHRRFFVSYLDSLADAAICAKYWWGQNFLLVFTFKIANDWDLEEKNGTKCTNILQIRWKELPTSLSPGAKAAYDQVLVVLCPDLETEFDKLFGEKKNSILDTKSCGYKAIIP